MPHNLRVLSDGTVVKNITWHNWDRTNLALFGPRKALAMQYAVLFMYFNPNQPKRVSMRQPSRIKGWWDRKTSLPIASVILKTHWV